MPILEEMKNIVVLFADSLRIFDLVSNRMCSFEKSLAWGCKVPECAKIFVFTDENFQEKIKKILPITAALFVSLIIARCFMYSSKIYGLKWDVLHKVFVWSGILFMFGAAKTFFDFNSRFTQYFARASFAIYVIHQSVIVILGFFAAGYFKVPYAFQYFSLVFSSFGITVLIYEILKRFKLTCFLFGIKFNQ